MDEKKTFEYPPAIKALNRTELYRVWEEKAIMEALEVMRKHHISSVLVENQGKEIVGIVTLADIRSRALSAGLQNDISSIMTEKILTVPLDRLEIADLADIAGLMHQTDIHHILVTKDKELIGLISSKDLIRVMAESAKTIDFEIPLVESGAV